MENENMARKYYTLCERTPGQLWTPEFGDYSKAVVEQERRDRKESGSHVKGTQFKIITTSGKQAAIAEEIETMNAGATVAAAFKEQEHSLTTRLNNGVVELRSPMYGHIADISKVPEGQCMGGMYLIAWSNDAIGWGPMWRHSMKAAEYTALSYVYELEATGH